MRVLMLGWEYPPHISGGLGTACEGLTKALARRGVEIDFVVPWVYGEEEASHMHLLSASQREFGVPSAPFAESPPKRSRRAGARPPQKSGSAEARDSLGVVGELPLAIEWASAIDDSDAQQRIQTLRIPAMLKPYLNPSTYRELVRAVTRERVVGENILGEKISSEEVLRSAGSSLEDLVLPPEAVLELAELTEAALRDLEDEGSAEEPAQDDEAPAGRGAHYGDDLFAEVARYAAAATRTVTGRKYDLVHAHDWMTFPAGVSIAEAVGAPLLAHVHSLEFDRAAGGADQDIVSVERYGLAHASRIIAVSYYTRNLIHELHGTDLRKISVVHNGVYTRQTVEAYASERKSTGPVVLFLGRVTFQKGPEYFVEAAARVLKHVPDAKFVMAGSGDMLPRMKALVERLGIEDSFQFPGFVRGDELERTFSTADVYVMPSVSEPFGIAPLEAMSYDRPVIVSKQSGVSEVLRNALKVDFWDVDKMASQIVGLLELPELRRVIVERAREEIRSIHWDAAAEKLVPIYQSLSAT